MKANSSTKSKKNSPRASALADQKPIKRARRKSKPTARARSSHGGRSNAARFLPFIMLLFGVIAVGCLLFVGYRTATAAAVFQVRQIDVSGTSRVSPDDVRNVVRRSLDDRNVWRADLDLISSRLNELTWVRHAVVTRVLPDGLRVRIVERTPLAVVRTRAGRFVWVDEQGVRLIERKPADAEPPFSVTGWNESGGNDAQAENQKRLQVYTRLVDGFARAGITEQVSEVDLSNLNEVRADLAGKYAGIYALLGADNWDVRLGRALTTLSKQNSLPFDGRIAYLDARQPNVIVGFDKDVPVTPEPTTASTSRASTEHMASPLSGAPANKANAANRRDANPAAAAGGNKTPSPVAKAQAKPETKGRAETRQASHPSPPPKKLAAKKG